MGNDLKNDTNNKVKDLPIGIFDSGVGGLSIAKCISQTLPNEQLIYVADSAHAPYGQLTVDQIQHRAKNITAWLVEQPVKAVVVACNTATVNAIDSLRQQFSLPIVGVEPAIKPAAQLSKNKKVAILVTQATANNQRFLQLIERYKQASQVIVQACPGLVELIETGQTQSVACYQLLQKYLSPLMAQDVDTLVLGCTHYPFVRQQIKQITEQTMVIMETAQPVSDQLKRRLSAADMLSTRLLTSPRFLSTKYNAAQQDIFNNLWQKAICVEKLN